jgi:hypothetical protein
MSTHLGWLLEWPSCQFADELLRFHVVQARDAWWSSVVRTGGTSRADAAA